MLIFTLLCGASKGFMKAFKGFSHFVRDQDVKVLEKGYSSNRQNEEWLLFSAGFTAKFELVLVLTQGNAFFKINRKSIGSSKNCTRNYFQNNYVFEKLACFYVTITENFEHLQYLNFESNFAKIENQFQKAGVMFFS